jgi:hypothetical protein
MLSTHSVPGVNGINATILEVCDVAGCELGPANLGDGCDLRVGVADGSAEGAAMSGNLGKSSRCVAVEPEDAGGGWPRLSLPTKTGALSFSRSSPEGEAFS